MAKLRTRTVFAGKNITVTAVESLEFRFDRGSHPRLITGCLRPIAIIVKELDRAYAFDMSAQPVEVDRLDLPADFELE